MSADDSVTQRTIAVVLAGGKGTRLDPLTRDICKPALSFGGAYRCIDFSLSNCVNSGLRTIGVATQYQPDALLAHLWSHWNSVAVGNDVVVRAWRAEERAARFGYRGTADAVYRNLGSIPEPDDSLVLILAGDHVYKMDYRPMLAEHVARNAGVTIGCIEGSIEDARHFGVLGVHDDGLVGQFVEKPCSRTAVPCVGENTVLVSMGIYVFEAAFLARALRDDAARPDSEHDFGRDILPRVIAGGRAYAYPFRAFDDSPAYWRDIGTLQAYWQAHMDLLGPTPLFKLVDPRWPIGRAATAPQIVGRPMRTAAGGVIEDSVVAAGCTVGGRVSRSVLAENVTIQRGARVSETVVLPGASIGAHCRLHGVIVDGGCRVADGTVVERSGTGAEPPVLTSAADRAARHATSR